MLLRLSVALVLAVGGVGAMMPAAHACGGFFCSLQQPVDQAAERILFAKDGDDMIAHVQIQYTGPSENFSWIVPVPSAPELSVGSDTLFQTLRNTTRPQFNLDLTTVGECKNSNRFRRGFGGPVPQAASLEDSSSVNKSVQVVSQEQVGPFESVVLKGEDPAALKQWLKDNGYDVPPSVDPMLDPYVKNKMLLLALKLKKGRSDGDLQPIVMRYKGDKPMIPIQLTAVAATDDMDVQVWILGNQRAIPTNYPHVKINEARLDWLNRGSNYRSVVTEAMNEAGGQGFVTQYAGESSVINENVLQAPFDLERIQTLTDPVVFANEVRFLFTNQNQWLSFAARHIPKPGLLAEIEDSQFYNQLSTYASALEKAGVVVDTTAAVKELKETRVDPIENAQKLFAKHPYLTAMYTTLSPKEMTKDPTFDFNGDLPTVQNVQTAKGVRRCSSQFEFFEAPVNITTPSGLTYTVTGSQPLVTRPLPAVALTEDTNVTGMGATRQDNRAMIQAELLSIKQAPVVTPTVQPTPTASVSPAGAQVSATPSPRPAASAIVALPSAVSMSPMPEPEVKSGAGCACHSPNTPVPASEGAAEGASYALALLGFLGWRRHKQNTRK